MKITSKQIDEWARGTSAQSSLPRYVRRLIHNAGTITQIAIPAGDSINQPGWDGQLFSEQGNAWVPKGSSLWEMSCEGSVTAKANREYAKRTTSTIASVREQSCLVFITARKWPQKERWLGAKLTESKWKSIRAYDADDLEQWLEETAAVKLEFGDEIGISGDGVEYIGRHWRGWADQTDIKITTEAIFAHREALRDRFLTTVRERLNSNSAPPLTIRADSVEEATAFVAASIESEPELASKALVITAESGWRFAEQNPSLSILVAARPEIATRPTKREKTVVVIPYAAGDMEGQFTGAAAAKGQPEISLERLDIHDFERALIRLGFDDGDAKRLAVSTGRSWSVFRRRRANNPSIRRPPWLDAPQSHALSTLCLLGGWSADKKADREIVSELAQRKYELVERDLRHLARTDDAPIIEIGDVWRAKSPLELLDIFGDRVTRDELNRFFSIAKRILTVPAPELDLPDEQRYAAQIYGKARLESGLLLRSVCDTLIKLAVRGPLIPALSSANVDARVNKLVRDLLEDADRTRWLSLSAMLPELAEAAPYMFLDCIDRSLTRPDAPILSLLTENTGSGFSSRCWHSGLMWALERLAWAPQRLTRISLLLAKLSQTEIKGNWSNSPKNTLLDLFRSWNPQTAANIEQRIAAIDYLIDQEPHVTFELLDRLLKFGSDHSVPAARPDWRDEDTGAGRGVSGNETHAMLVAAADRFITMAKGNAPRVAKLINKIRNFDRRRVRTTLEYVEWFTASNISDSEKSIVRSALRHYVHKTRNYGDLKGAALESHLKRVNELYEKLAPKSPIDRHAWLFESGMPELISADYTAQFRLTASNRLEAVKEIYQDLGLEGIELASRTWKMPTLIGNALTKLDITHEKLIDWIIEKRETKSNQIWIDEITHGIIHAVEADVSIDIISECIKKSEVKSSNTEDAAHLLTLTRNDRAIWTLSASFGKDIDTAYWKICFPTIRPDTTEDDIHFAVNRLKEAQRPRSALRVCTYELKKIPPSFLAELLEGVLRGEEADGPLLDSYHLREAIDLIEASVDVSANRKISIGFNLVQALGYESEHHAKSLFEALTSDPKIFIELLSLAYRSTNEEEDTPFEDGTSEFAASNSWRILRACKRIPGTQNDGTVSASELLDFVEKVRDLAISVGRIGVCDSTLGQILAHAEPDIGANWPPAAVCDILDKIEAEEIRQGFYVGTKNRRGTTTRTYREGGSQERKLSETFRVHAARIANRYVRVAALLEMIASSYEDESLREDLDARLRREGR